MLCGNERVKPFFKKIFLKFLRNIKFVLLGVLSAWWAKRLRSDEFTANLKEPVIKQLPKLMVQYIGTPIHNLFD